MYSQMSTHMLGFGSFFSNLHHFVLLKLATTSIRVKGFSLEIVIWIYATLANKFEIENDLNF